MESINQSFIRYLWPDNSIDFVSSDSVGASGGILTMWDTNSFTIENKFVDRNFVGVIGSWNGLEGKIGILNVYAPQASHLKEVLWSSIDSFLASVNAAWIIFGDFNVVRFQEERMGCRFIAGEANAFNDFISSRGLFDFPLGGRKFTRFDRDGSKASKLDRFLVDHTFFNLWNDASISVLSRSHSDHCPILLKVSSPNFGPKPFKVFDKWLKMDEFRELISSSWVVHSTYSPPDIRLKNKLRSLRLDIKKRAMDKQAFENHHREELNKNLMDWDKRAEEGLISQHDIHKREEWVSDLLQLNRLRNKDLKQKCRIRWAVEGDENSHFFTLFSNTNSPKGPLRVSI
ncbi:cytochrome P450 [Tanacetum coccineum]|uniref:Cytochrome P450 n=1 Tax=Tanacetum coccineum TaxID=301880 RepID=A0ABQ4XSN1_9ASTR